MRDAYIFVLVVRFISPSLFLLFADRGHFHLTSFCSAKARFEDENGASFDAYGRVIRYGMSADDIDCSPKAAGKDGAPGGWSCKVTASSRRKYLTKEEKVIPPAIKPYNPKVTASSRRKCRGGGMPASP
jgi:hypothetical protein